MKKLDSNRSFIKSARSFPKNIEIKHVMTYGAEEPPERGQAGTISLLMNQSMILLPDDMMQPRLADYRVGWFTTKNLTMIPKSLKQMIMR